MDAAVGESYALLIYACVKLRRLDQAFVHFDTMVRRGLEPDPRVFAALLKGCGRARQLKRGERFFESLLDANAAGARSATAYNALINMYSHQKQRPATLLPHEVSNAWRAVDRMREAGVAPDEARRPTAPCAPGGRGAGWGGVERADPSTPLPGGR